MLTPRFVVDYVAERYGKLAPIILKDEEKIAFIKDGTLDPTTLENDKDRVRLRMARSSDNPAVALERVNGGNDFQDKYIVDKLSVMARSVCRILKNGNPYGTGFLVADDIILTNNHVISSPGEAIEMIAEFDYELTIDRKPKKSSLFAFDAGKFFLTSSLEVNDAFAYSGLDFTLVGLQKKGINNEILADFSPVKLDGNKGKIIKGECCVIIQHPNGLPKKIVLKDIAFFFETSTKIVYQSDTLPGSSGAMVVGLGTCEIVALHHSGFPRTNDRGQILTKSGTVATVATPDEEIDWIGNEGIKISKIIEALQNAVLPESMERNRQLLLNKTEHVSEQLTETMDLDTVTVSSSPTNSDDQVFNHNKNEKEMQTESSDFLVTLVNKTDVIRRVEGFLSNRYGTQITLNLAMPASSVEGKIELFSFTASFSGNVIDEAEDLVKLPEILNAEADIPLALNTNVQFEPTGNHPATESGFFDDDGLGTWDEPEFLLNYKDSPYVKSGKLDLCRKWNWSATKFDKVLSGKNIVSPKEAGIRIVQFDTGFTDHSKVATGFDLDQDFSFISDSDDATDPRNTGLGKQPGHGTRTGSLLIGSKPEQDPSGSHNGNEGLLAGFNYKLVPFRITESVIILNRQKQLAAALDRAIVQGFDIITMSLGLPPTISTAKMAKTAYDKGIIWCCAAGNEVQAVVAPAVYPGTIAVAASNPLDKPWKASSHGDMVDITAPGEDVYVPIWNKDRNEDYAYGNGTSYATPHIAAAAALWLAKYQDVLNSSAYSGWKRVEVFRNALKRSLQNSKRQLPPGYGAGILDMDSLLATKPLDASKLKYAYNNWNENAFFAALQGYGELSKTYWNILHGWLFKSKRKAQESIFENRSTMSSNSLAVEKELFKTSVSSLESVSPESQEKILDRYIVLQNIISNSPQTTTL